MCVLKFRQGWVCMIKSSKRVFTGTENTLNIHFNLQIIITILLYYNIMFANAGKSNSFNSSLECWCGIGIVAAVYLYMYIYGNLLFVFNNIDFKSTFHATVVYNLLVPPLGTSVVNWWGYTRPGIKIVSDFSRGIEYFQTYFRGRSSS